MLVAIAIERVRVGEAASIDWIVIKRAGGGVTRLVLNCDASVVDQVMKTFMVSYDFIVQCSNMQVASPKLGVF